MKHFMIRKSNWNLNCFKFLYDGFPRIVLYPEINTSNGNNNSDNITLSNITGINYCTFCQLNLSACAVNNSVQNKEKTTLYTYDKRDELLESGVVNPITLSVLKCKISGISGLSTYPIKFTWYPLLRRDNV